MNGTVYVGQHRGQFNPRYLGSGVIFIQALRKHGRKAFAVELLCWAEPKGQLDAEEISYIKTHREAGIALYNISAGGVTGPGYWPTGAAHQSFGKKRSEETRAKMSAAAKKRGAYPPEVYEKIACQKRGVKRPPFSEEHLKNLSLAHMGKPSARKGKTHSEETREKMRLAWLTRPPLTAKQRKNISVAVRLAWVRRKKQPTLQN